jgi:hypothetical protein
MSKSAWKKAAIITAGLFAVYVLWVGSSNGAKASTDSATIQAFPGNARFKNYELTARLSSVRVVKLFTAPYKVYDIDTADFGDSGSYLDFEDCKLDSRQDHATCNAYSCDRSENVEALMQNKTLSVDDLSNECDKTLDAWAVKLKSEN